MKLILCRKCQDVLKAGKWPQPKFCLCGESGALYERNGVHALYWGEFAVPLGFANSTLVKAIDNQPQVGMGEPFEAFVVPVECDTFLRVEDFPKENPKPK